MNVFTNIHTYMYMYSTCRYSMCTVRVQGQAQCMKQYGPSDATVQLSAYPFTRTLSRELCP